LQPFYCLAYSEGTKSCHPEKNGHRNRINQHQNTNRLNKHKSHENRSHENRSNENRSHENRSHENRSHENRSHEMFPKQEIGLSRIPTTAFRSINLFSVPLRSGQKWIGKP
jgi:hypothetical protein